ncbi:MAG: hypothetical protein U0903_13275 [Planctomycetales bacterium]
MICLIVAGALSLAVLRISSVTIMTPGERVLAEEHGLRWYRGNMHTHSLWSDGDDYLEGVALWYRQNKYDFLVITDHNVLPNRERWTEVEKNKGKEIGYRRLRERFPDWVVERKNDQGKTEVRLRTFQEVAGRLNEPGKFLLVLGEEITDSFQGIPIHMNATNVRDLIPPQQGESVSETIQRNFDAVQKQREISGQSILFHINHPNWRYCLTAEDMMRLEGGKFFEVYNGITDMPYEGDSRHASMEKIWDIMLAHRLSDLKLPVMYGLATDDSHQYHQIPSRNDEPGRGWVMVLADKLEPKSIIDAMEQGRFYATTGVELETIQVSDKEMRVTIREEAGVEYTVEFIGTKKNFPRDSQPALSREGKPFRATRRYSPEIGTVLRKFNGNWGVYEFQPDDLYVRARITSSRKHPNPSIVGEPQRAWVQPHPGPAAASSNP